MKKFSFVMPDFDISTTPPVTDVPGYRSGDTDAYSIGPGISTRVLPDGSVVNVDPQGNILKDIVD